LITHTGTLHQRLFPSAVWKMPTDSIYLTFDDGPHPTATEEVLRALQVHNAPATFFLTGENISGNESLVREIASAGHTIGNHGYWHSRIPALSSRKTRRTIQETASAIQYITPRSKKIFRPPFGFFTWHTFSVARELGYQVILWTVLTRDFEHSGNSRIISNAMSRLSAGSVLVFHDNTRTMDKIGSIVSECIERIRDLGFSFRSM